MLCFFFVHLHNYWLIFRDVMATKKINKCFSSNGFNFAIFVQPDFPFTGK